MVLCSYMKNVTNCTYWFLIIIFSHGDFCQNHTASQDSQGYGVWKILLLYMKMYMKVCLNVHVECTFEMLNYIFLSNFHSFLSVIVVIFYLFRQKRV